VVSAVLNGTPGIRVSEEKRRAVLQAIEDLGYRVDVQARGMRTGRSRCIGAYGNLDNPLFLQVLQGAQRVCTEAGYQLLLYGKGDRAGEREELIALYRARRIDGLITKDTTGYDDGDWADMVHAAGLPFVSVEGYPERSDISSILMDYGASIELALDYIWKQTGSAPCYVLAHHGDPSRLNWGDRHRLLAYRRWMELKGLSPQIAEISLGEPDELEAWTGLLAGKTLPAVLLCNWFVGCSRLYRACTGLGLAVGTDVRIMSADNTAQANGFMVPSLSSVEVPYTEMGAAAARQLIQSVEGNREAEADQEAEGGRKAGEGREAEGGQEAHSAHSQSKLWIPPRLAPRESM
jgi:LacI family transcriptional regulator